MDSSVVKSFKKSFDFAGDLVISFDHQQASNRYSLKAFSC
jgi:hypothetical protein